MNKIDYEYRQDWTNVVLNAMKSWNKPQDVDKNLLLKAENDLAFSLNKRKQVETSRISGNLGDPIGEYSISLYAGNFSFYLLEITEELDAQGERTFITGRNLLGGFSEIYSKEIRLREIEGHPLKIKEKFLDIHFHTEKFW